MRMCRIIHSSTRIPVGTRCGPDRTSPKNSISTLLTQWGGVGTLTTRKWWRGRQGRSLWEPGQKHWSPREQRLTLHRLSVGKRWNGSWVVLLWRGYWVLVGRLLHENLLMEMMTNYKPLKLHVDSRRRLVRGYHHYRLILPRLFEMEIILPVFWKKVRLHFAPREDGWGVGLEW